MHHVPLTCTKTFVVKWFLKTVQTIWLRFTLISTIRVQSGMLLTVAMKRRAPLIRSRIIVCTVHMSFELNKISQWVSNVSFSLHDVYLQQIDTFYSLHSMGASFHFFFLFIVCSSNPVSLLIFLFSFNNYLYLRWSLKVKIWGYAHSVNFHQG